MELALFWAFGALALVATLLTIGARSPIYAALFMILSFAATAGVFVLLDAYLIAVVEVLVYAGAIMVLFLFVIMLINLRNAEQESLRLSPLTLLVAAVFLVMLGRAVGDLGPAVASEPNALVGEPGLIAESLFTRYVVPFEAISMLLLAAILGTVVLSRKNLKA